MHGKKTISSFQLAVNTKPNLSIKNIKDSLSIYGKPFHLSASQRLFLSDAFIVLMDNGCFSYCQLDNNYILSTIFSPSVVGISRCLDLYHYVSAPRQFYIHSETECYGWIIPADIFITQCGKLSLWEDISKILAYDIMIMSARENEVVGKDAYSKVRSLLHEVWIYPENVRRAIKISAFIQRRTKLSRTRVMSLLACLKKHGYLEIKSGVLLHLSELPEHL